MITSNYKKYFLVLSALFLIVNGCARRQENVSIRKTKPAAFIKTSMSGKYHTVKRGETLWRISKTYGVDLNELAKFNKISNSCTIETGQKIFVPEKFQNSVQYSQIEAGNFMWPCKGQLLSCFNETKKSVKNNGIDIAARKGATICASADGNVVFTSENMRGYGKTIIIQHRGGFATVYANSEKNLVKIGDYVQRGQKIAHAGKSGRTSRNIVHFELRKNNQAQNPIHYLP